MKATAGATVTPRAIQALAKMRPIDIVVLTIAQALVAGRGFRVEGCDPLTVFFAEEIARHLGCNLSFTLDGPAEIVFLPR
jgi:hypothetical protein